MEEAIEEAIVVESGRKFGGVEDELDCQRPEVHDPQVLADAMSGSMPTFSTAPPLQDEDDGDAVQASTQGRTSRVTFGDPGAGCHPDRTLPRPGSQESRCYTSFTRTGSGSRSEGGRSTPEGTGSDWIRRTTLAAMSGALRTNSSTSSLQRADTPEPELSTFSVPPREPRFPSGRTRVVSATVYSYPFAKRPTESKTARSVESGGHVSPVGSEQNPRTLPAAARQLEKRYATVTGSPQHVTAKMHAAPESRARSMGAESAKLAESAGSVGKAGRGVAARPLQPATGPGGFAVGSSWRNLSDKRRPSTASAAGARASSTGPGEASPREMRATARSADGPSRHPEVEISSGLKNKTPKHPVEFQRPVRPTHVVMRAWSECDHDGRECRSKGPAKKQQQRQEHEWEPRRSGKARSQAATLDEELDKYFAQDKPKEPPEPKVELSPEEKQDRMVAAMLLRSARSKASVRKGLLMAALYTDEHPASVPEFQQKVIHEPGTSAISKNIPLSEVNRHCTPENCWVALNGKVYDLSEFMDRHPGGPTTILAWAGKDASKFFNEIHKGVKIDAYLRPEAFLGDLGVDENLMSDDFWHTLREARIVEIRQEVERLLNRCTKTHKADSIPRLLQDKNVDPELKKKLQRLKTQERAALDAEDFAKAAEVKRGMEELLSHEDHAHKHDVPMGWTSSDIPLSEVARHNKPHDCWIAICGEVYDLTDFLQHHQEQRNSILAWAGRDATPMFDKIPGRFPSKQWMEYYMRPEFKTGKVGPEKPVDSIIMELQELHDELRRLEGPSKEEIEAVKTAVKVPGKTDAPTLSEESRFPKLAEISAGKDLPFFSRAEVAKHNTADEPYMIIHNRVYNLKPLLGSHPGGDDILMSKAGTDCTKDFEVFEHSEKARVQRDREMLVGQLVPAENTDWSETAAVQQVVGEETSEIGRYLKYKVTDVAVAALAWYLFKTFQNRKPLSQFTYSRALRHLHLIMAVGIFGAVGTAQAASYSEGQAKKQMLWWHKQTGIVMLVALVFRVIFRLQSGIPPRFPGNKVVQMIETQSLRAFYAFALLLPVSGIANEYFLKWAPGSDKTGNAEDDRRNDRLAKQSIDAHKVLGKVLQYAWLPFHLGYTTLYHYSQGRGVVRKAEQAEASGMTAYLEEDAQLNKSVNKRLLAGEVSQARSFNRRTGIEPLPAAAPDSAPLSVEEREAKALEQEYVRSAHQMREQPPPPLPKETAAPTRKKQRVGTQGKLLDLAAMEEEAARQADEEAESANPLLRPPPKLAKRKAPKAADEDTRGLVPKRESLEEQEQSLWPSKGMRVRVLSETGELKTYHLQTGVVRRRHAARGAVDVALDDSDRMLKMVPQGKLQTFVSKTCSRIEVVRGGHRGVIAELVSQDAGQKLATIRLGRGQAQQELVVSLHDVCEFI
ncbi:Cyt-b5 [Symbiodinium sp. CCMP2592]|nr:Cyt-b5 [Symbiodinium sp. CCMP2592]